MVTSLWVILTTACSEPDADQNDKVEDTATLDTSRVGDTAENLPQWPLDTASLPDGDGDGTPDHWDCDPEDPYIYPGAEEWCDPIDHNCDGEPLETGVCGKPQLIQALAQTVITGYDIGPAFVGPDTNGDGLNDLVVQSDHREFVHVIKRKLPYGQYDIESVSEGAFTTDTLRIGDFAPLDDFNGDGYADIAVVADFWGGYYNGGESYLYILTGPASDWSKSPGFQSAYVTYYVSTWSYADPDEWERFSNSIAAGDINGDGLTDLAMPTGITTFPEYQENPNHATSAIFILGQTNGPTGLQGMPEAIRGLGGRGIPVTAIGDIDGDGLDDMNFNLYIVKGADISSSDVFHFNDVDIYLNAHDQCGGNDFVPQIGIGDWDDDGLDDVLTTCRYDISNENNASSLLLGGAQINRIEDSADIIDVMIGAWSVPDSYSFGVLNAVPDIDGDNRMDVAFSFLFEETVDGCVSCSGIAPSHLGIPIPYSDAREGALLSYRLYDSPTKETTSSVYFQRSNDLNGDGDSELISTYTVYMDGADINVLSIIPGWDIPWYDPEYW